MQPASAPARPAVGRLHVLTDTALQSRWTHAQLFAFAQAAHVPVVQYREKEFSEKEHLKELRQIAAIAKESATRLLVNDSLALALEVGAQGVHLGASDDDPATALAALPSGALVGATVHSLAELEALAHLPLSYIGVGPVHGTTSKAHALPPLTLAGLAEICRASPFPVIAIGGMAPGRARAALEAGAHGVAALGAFCLADDPRAVAEQLLEEIGR